MQTFLPLPDFADAVATLDDKRLGKQRVECLQILKALHDSTYGWQNHPAVKMWRGHEQALVRYSVETCHAWIARGFKDTCLEKIETFADGTPSPTPPWVTQTLCLSHQSNLVRKLPDHYKRHFPDVPPCLPYFWPV